MIIKQGPVAEPPVVRYEYSYSYDFRSEKATTKALPLESKSKSLLNLLSSAASAVVDEEESSTASSSSSHQAQGIRPSSSTLSSSLPTPPPKNQALPVVDRSRQLPPVAFAVRRSPPSAFGTRMSTSPTLSPPSSPPTLSPPHQQALPVFPQHYSPSAYARSLHMPPGMEITFAGRTKQTPIPTTVTSIGSRRKLPAKASAFVPKAAAKKQTPKYKMKYQYVSMKRSEAIKYIEALSKSGSQLTPAPYMPQPWQQPHHPPSPVGVRAPLPAQLREARPIAVAIPANAVRVYHLPLATAVIPRY